MENKISQKEWVLDKLKTNGYVSRNQCLRNYISRLGAIIWTLKDDGYIISSKIIKKGKRSDYIYKLDNKQKELWNYKAI